MPEDFDPSPQSTPKEQAVRQLRYLRGAARRLEEQLLTAEGDPPLWVLTRIMQGAQALGMALSYAQSQSAKRVKLRPKKPKRPKKPRRTEK